MLRLNDGDSGPCAPWPSARRACWTNRRCRRTIRCSTMARSNGRARASTDRTTDPEVLAALADRKAWDVLVVPLRSGDRDRGYLEVRDRLSRWGRFRDEDLQLLETLGGHVATALDNLRLLEIAAARGLSRRDHRPAQPARAARRGPGRDGHRTRAARSCWSSSTCCPQVNNALGHDRGERLLRMAGERLVAAGRPGPAGRPDRGRPVRRAGRCDARGRARPRWAPRSWPPSAVAYSLDGIEVDPQAASASPSCRADRRGRRRQRPGPEHPAAAGRDGHAGRQGQAGAAPDLPAEHG